MPCIKIQFPSPYNTLSSPAFGSVPYIYAHALAPGAPHAPTTAPLAGQMNSTLRETASFGQIFTPSFGYLSTFNVLN